MVAISCLAAKQEQIKNSCTHQRSWRNDGETFCSNGLKIERSWATSASAKKGTQKWLKSCQRLRQSLECLTRSTSLVAYHRRYKKAGYLKTFWVPQISWSVMIKPDNLLFQFSPSSISRQFQGQQYQSRYRFSLSAFNSRRNRFTKAQWMTKTYDS